jgi:two-component system response regulator YesN
MKIIIADDETLVRDSLSSMIKDMETSWQIYSDATNGEELLELVAEHQPDIVIVDIRMPKLNGLDAIQRGKSISPLTNWVVLSGFSDFSYAQQALKLGVSEYLLKPVDPAELEKTLNHIYKDNKEYMILLNQQFENSLFALCNGLSSLKHEERDSLLYQGTFIGWTFNIDTAQPASCVSGIQRKLYEDLYQCMNKHLLYGMNLALLALPNGELAAIGAWDSTKCQGAKQFVQDFFRVTEEIVSSYRNTETMITILKTDECRGFEAVNGRLQQLQQLGNLRAVCGFGQSLDYLELIKVAEIPYKVEAARLLCAIGYHLQNWMYLNYQNAVNELEALLLQKSNLFLSEKTLHAIHLFIRYTLGLTFQDNTMIPEMIRELRQYGENVLRELCAKEPPFVDLVKQVIQYIEKHYMDDIGIGQIAGQLNVSANYLSALFHKKTGMLFVKYLTRIRMLKANELLISTNLQVRQVAEQVGYYSTRHFTKLFTQTFGNYPSDCRKNPMQSNF